MKLALVAIVLALVIGRLAGGRLANLAGNRIRWSGLAFAGLALQLAPLPGHVLPLAGLFVSFAVLGAFALRNLRLPGFPLILVGLALNFSVIAVNAGMPVTRHALDASGQDDTLSLLVHHGGAKHHLAGSGDHLVLLGDVIAVPPLHQAVSIGDVLTYSGVLWLISAGMRRRDEDVARSPASAMPEPSHVGS